jgi:hypothetical protein
MQLVHRFYYAIKINNYAIIYCKHRIPIVLYFVLIDTRRRMMYYILCTPQHIITIMYAILKSEGDKTRRINLLYYNDNIKTHHPGGLLRSIGKRHFPK